MNLSKDFLNGREWDETSAKSREWRAGLINIILFAYKIVLHFTLVEGFANGKRPLNNYFISLCDRL